MTPPASPADRAARARVCCRPGTSEWVPALTLALYGCLGMAAPLLDPRKSGPGDRALLGVFAAALFLVGLLLSVRAVVRVVIADEAGLRWRTLRGWSATAWAEIQDYYDESAPAYRWSSVSGKDAVILTHSGTLRIASDWARVQPLRA